MKLIFAVLYGPYTLL